MSKPTKWQCAQRRLRTAWAFAQSDQSLHSALNGLLRTLSACGQRRLWSDWADAQAPLSLCWAHIHFVGFVMSRLRIGIRARAGTYTEPHNNAPLIFGPRQANLVLIAYASSEGSGEPAHPRSLARTSAARSYKQWVKRILQTKSQIPGPF